MGPLLGFVLLAQASDRTQAILPEVVFENTDAREAFRWLFRAGGFGGTVAPDVRGNVTLHLRNVPWETALQNVTRQVDATYRVENGWFEVVLRSEFDLGPEMVPSTDVRTIDSAYGVIASAIAAGRGDDLRRALEPTFEDRNATRTLSGETAVQALLATVRARPAFKIERVGWLHDATAVYLVSYGVPNVVKTVYRDLWRKSDGRWRLAAREETALDIPKGLVIVPLSEVLRNLGQGIGVRVIVDPAVDRPVTFDAAPATFETALAQIVRSADATYRIVGGVYEVVPRVGGSVLDRVIPFMNFEGGDVRVAASWLFQQVHVDYRFDPRVKGSVNVSLRNVTFEVALANLLRQVDATYRTENGVFVVVPGGEPVIADPAIGK